jgi:hypothetical protein
MVTHLFRLLPPFYRWIDPTIEVSSPPTTLTLTRITRDNRAPTETPLVETTCTQFSGSLPESPLG